MPQPKENVLAKLKEQMQFLRTSLRPFYEGEFAESVRIATIIRVLVHETGRSKPLLNQARPNGLDLPILDQASERPDEKAIFRFAVSARIGPTIAPAVDLGSSHYAVNTVGAWWNAEVFTFQSRLGRQLVYTRKKIVLTIPNKKGGAPLDQNQDPHSPRLLPTFPPPFPPHLLPT